MTQPTLTETIPTMSPPEPKPVDSWEDIAEDDSPSESPKTTAVATSVGEVTSESDKKRTSEAAKDESNEEVRPKVTNGSKSKGFKVDSAKSLSMQVAPKAEDEKENVNIIFIGHVDAGKSTIGGHLMYVRIHVISIIICVTQRRVNSAYFYSVFNKGMPLFTVTYTYSTRTNLFAL